MVTKQESREATSDKHFREVVNQFIREFAELNLGIVAEIKDRPRIIPSPELLKELRENAQVLNKVILQEEADSATKLWNTYKAYKLEQEFKQHCKP